jgi:hypothetical protein
MVRKETNMPDIPTLILWAYGLLTIAALLLAIALMELCMALKHLAYTASRYLKSKTPADPPAPAVRILKRVLMKTETGS